VTPQAIAITQTIILSGIQFVQRGKKLAMVLDGLRADAAQPPGPPWRIRPMANYQWMKTVLSMCFVQTLQRVKVNRFLESNEDSINPQPEGKTKFLPISLPAPSLRSREEF